MSIATEISRIQTAEADIKTAITGKGVAVPEGSKINDLPALIIAIPTGGGGDDDLTKRIFTLTGDCSYKFYHGGWDWLVEEYGDKFALDGMTRCASMFAYSGVKEIPIIFAQDTKVSSAGYMFQGASNLVKAPDLSGLQISGACNYLFADCMQMETADISFNEQSSPSTTALTFYNCPRLKSVSPDFLKKFFGQCLGRAASTTYMQSFHSCYQLKRINELGVANNASTSVTQNLFSNTFTGCSMLESLTFADASEGRKWTKQALDLSGVGYTAWSAAYNFMCDYYPQLEVTDFASYATLKEQDYWTDNYMFSRYGHNSAVETINSLPVISDGTITFKADAGAGTEQGGISTMTAEEIAVATNKGWTVTFV